MGKKNFNRHAKHRELMFRNMLKEFKGRGYLTTTEAKAKQLKSLIQSELGESIHSFRLKRRVGDGAQLIKLISTDKLAELNK